MFVDIIPLQADLYLADSRKDATIWRKSVKCSLYSGLLQDQRRTSCTR
ncbi:hypothetical protein M3J09_010653 [Ascochyta lentis]